MIGCLILGTVVAVVAAKVVRHRHGCMSGHGGYGGYGGHGRHHGGWHGFGPPWGPMRGFHPGERGFWPAQHAGGGGGEATDGSGEGDGEGMPETFARRGWPGRGLVVGTIVRHVRATATQEKVIKTAFDEFRQEMKDVGGGEGKKTRQDVGAALRKPQFDEVFMGELFARQDTAIEKTRKAFMGLIAKVHEVLDEEQRARLAELVEKGPRFWRRAFDW